MIMNKRLKNTNRIKDWTKFFLLIVTLAIPATPVWAQQGSEPGMARKSNQCLLHLDKPFYVTGEIIWFKADMPENLIYNQSLLRVDLVRKDGSSVFQFYRPIEKDLSSFGSIKIPYDFSPDVYLLVLSLTREEDNEVQTTVNYLYALNI